MGLSAQEILKTDPEFVQRQLAAQEMQRLNPSGDAAGAIGALLGRGVSNVARGRGFFEPNNPGLQRVTDVNNIMKSVRFDPKNPAAYYEQVGTALQEAGYADLAPMAFSEAQKFMPKAETVAVAPGGTLVDKRTGKVVFQAPERDRDVKLANRLVELDTKLATEGLTPKEAAEKNALERVVRIQSPKGTTVDFTGIGEVLAKKASEEEGKELGKSLAALEGKRQAVESLTNARQILSQGVYTGSYANFQTELAKKSLGAVGDLRRVENTEVFLNEVSSNVIPLLQEFGGNDSNEELKFLQRLVGGDVTLQQKSIERILDNAVRKINRGIERTAARGQAVREGKPPEIPKPTTKTEKRTTKGGVTYEIVGD